jgi:hypothetical protein
MKKTLVVAALVVASVMPTLPASAAAMKPAAKAEPVPAYCFFLPLLPKCVDAWKSEMGSMKMDMKLPMMGMKK